MNSDKEYSSTGRTKMEFKLIPLWKEIENGKLRFYESSSMLI